MKKSTLSVAVFAALYSVNLSAFCEEVKKVEGAIVITANPLNKDLHEQVLTPTKVLAGTELRMKLASNLGDTLSQELGVSASGFGVGASRPIIRGLEGTRVKILQNGMNIADVSAISNDHAVASDVSSAQQIEVLRGPSSLLYGSGAIGGVVNVVDNRIPHQIDAGLQGEAEIRTGSANNERTGNFSLDTSSQALKFHLDGSSRRTDDFKLPGSSLRQPSSDSRSNSVTIGAALHPEWGHVGGAYAFMKERYGIPTEEKSFIEMEQKRLDLDGHYHEKGHGNAEYNFKLGATDYKHTEFQRDGEAATFFKNKVIESRFEYLVPELAGWRSNLGVQIENQEFSALSAQTLRADAVPVTQSKTLAAFALTRKNFGDILFSAGARIENVKRNPQGEMQSRKYNLLSSSVGIQYQLGSGQSIGASFASAQRAPSTEELYSHGPHESTASFDIGDQNLKKETSQNIELSYQKQQGDLRWQWNVYFNRMQNFVYGFYDGFKVDEEGVEDEGAEFSRRYFRQADARLWGTEAELSFNQLGQGLGWRLFAETSRSKLERQGNLPLQPASRVGLDVSYKHQGWRTGLSVVRAFEQNRLASFETFVTPAYTKLDLSVSYTQKIGQQQWQLFAMIKNALDKDIRLSTSVLKEHLPQLGRNLQVGARVQF